MRTATSQKRSDRDCGVLALLGFFFIFILLFSLALASADVVFLVRSVAFLGWFLMRFSCFVGFFIFFDCLAMRFSCCSDFSWLVRDAVFLLCLIFYSFFLLFFFFPSSAFSSLVRHAVFLLCWVLYFLLIGWRCGAIGEWIFSLFR